MNSVKPATTGAISDASAVFDHVSIEVEALLGAKQMTIGELKGLSESAVIPLSTSLSDPVELRVNGKVIGFGEIVAMNENFAVRIVRLSE